MAAPSLGKRTIEETHQIWLSFGRNNTATARELGIDEHTVRNRLKQAEVLGMDVSRPNYDPPKKPAEFSVESPPDDDISVEELLEHRKKQFAKRVAHEKARKLIPVKVKIDGPIGILHFGDPHVDDDGTDIGLLEHHKKLCQTVEGLFGANVGDVTNNWVGRLARLYEEQSTSGKQAWALAEWLLNDLKLLYLIGGNHDGWSGTGDPLKWITRQAGSLYQSSEVRVSLNFPNGAQIRINARHDFAGGSQWNPAHGPMKAVFHGVRDHISICGHKHKSGYGIIKDPDTGIACHCFQVASYKLYDRFARDKGFRDQSLGPCVLTVIDPSLPNDHPDLVKPFWDADEGVWFLKQKRK